LQAFSEYVLYIMGLFHMFQLKTCHRGWTIAG
jgi:hypothetical protein